MRAGLRVQAACGQAETLDRPAVDEVFGDDLFDVFEVDKAIPDGLGIDHDNRAVLALVETASLVGADDVLETGIFDGVLEGGF